MISDYICKISIDNYLVWLQNSNKYIVIDSKLLKLINDKPKFSENIFLNKISQSLNINLSKSKDIYIEINNLLFEFNQPIPIAHKPIYQKLIPCDIICFYKFNNVSVKVCFDSEQSKRLIDPKFKHLTSLDTDNFNVQFFVFKNKSKIFLFKNDVIVGSWNKTEMHEFQGKFSMEFLCSSYNNSEHDWMGVFHASTISKNNKSIMFTGDSGNGKSTLISLLMANGYNIIADDFTPILRSDLKTYCFPTAISVKEKSFDLIKLLHPQIKDLDQYYIDDIKGHVKYLPPVTDKISANCNSVVWVKYAKDLDNNLEKISTENALQKFLPDAWISNHEVNAKAFMKWVKRTNFYELKYSDNKKLISLVDSLFLD